MIGFGYDPQSVSRRRLKSASKKLFNIKINVRNYVLKPQIGGWGLKIQRIKKYIHNKYDLLNLLSNRNVSYRNRYRTDLKKNFSQKKTMK